MSIYIAGSIRNTKDKTPFYEKIEQLVKNITGEETYLPHRDTAEYLKDYSTNLNVYNKNITAVRNSKLIVAEVSNPSLGTGMELQEAFVKQIPIILLIRNGVDLSWMVRDFIEKFSVAKLIHFNTEEEALRNLETALKEWLDGKTG